MTSGHAPFRDSAESSSQARNTPSVTSPTIRYCSLKLIAPSNFRASHFIRGSLTPVVIVALAAATHILHLAGDSASAIGASSQVFLPNGRVMRTFSMGQQTTIADLFWLRLVEYIGDPHTPQSQPQLFGFADLVTDLDPEYSYAYIVGGLLLATRGRLHESNNILLKGFRHTPNRWEIPFYLGFNHWYELNDPVAGAAWFEIASRSPDAPAYLARLVARLASSSGQLDATIEVFRQRRQLEPDQAKRLELTSLLQSLETERDLQLIEQAIDQFRLRNGYPPHHLDDLIGIISSIPLDLDRAPFDYDPISGKVTSRFLTKRLSLTHAQPQK
jgi:tetratricopeptide (TPR) repeat protein